VGRRPFRVVGLTKVTVFSGVEAGVVVTSVSGRSLFSSMRGFPFSSRRINVEKQRLWARMIDG
jgi:hypothetical protein